MVVLTVLVVSRHCNRLGTLLKSVVENLRLAVGISKLYVVYGSRDIHNTGFGGHIDISRCL